MIAIDVGTMFLVKAEIDDLTEQPAYTTERNAFLQLASNEDTEDTLKENNWSYVKHENSFFVLGEDALKLKNLLTVNSKHDKDIVIAQVGELRRPMKDGVLNTAEEKLSVAIIQQIIKNLVGKPKKPGETLCFCYPGDAVDRNVTALFHKTMLTNFFQGLGYSVESIPEALAIIYSERPVAEDPSEEGGEAPFSGISMSFGAGQVNACFAWKRMPLICFSVARSGDFIDREAAKVAGVDVAAMTRIKESKLDLANIDHGDIKQAALDIFYQNMIEHALMNFAQKFNSLDNKIEVPLEIVVAGGTASVPGFIPKFESVVQGLELPFKIKKIRLADNPLFAVAKGCLIKAMSVESKKSPKEK